MTGGSGGGAAKRKRSSSCSSSSSSRTPSSGASGPPDGSASGRPTTAAKKPATKKTKAKAKRKKKEGGRKPPYQFVRDVSGARLFTVAPGSFERVGGGSLPAVRKTSNLVMSVRLEAVAAMSHRPDAAAYAASPGTSRRAPPARGGFPLM
jgi:hypothetical protein